MELILTQIILLMVIGLLIRFAIIISDLKKRHYEITKLIAHQLSVQLLKQQRDAKNEVRDHLSTSFNPNYPYD